jgi:hypothetical protein
VVRANRAAANATAEQGQIGFTVEPADLPLLLICQKRKEKRFLSYRAAKVLTFAALAETHVLLEIVVWSGAGL